MEQIEIAGSFDQIYGFRKKIQALPISEKIEILQAIIRHAHQEKDNNNILLDLYCRLANIYHYSLDPKLNKLYLDSAYLYLSKSKNPLLIGNFHISMGSYYSRLMQDSISHNYYYQALSFYEKVDPLPLSSIVPLYYNLSFTYFQKQDLINLERIVNKIRPHLSDNIKISPLFNMNIIMTYYHNTIYKKKKDSTHLDSTLFYDKKILNLYDSIPQKGSFSDIISYIYINYAENLLEKKDNNLENILELADKGINIANPSDTAMIINYHWVKGKVLFQQQKYPQAKAIFCDQLNLMQQWKTAEDLAMYIDLYDMLSQTSSAMNHHQEALAYEKKKEEYADKIHDKEKYEIIEELQTKYEVNKKNMEIDRLNERTAFQQRINWLFFILCVALAIASVMIFFWYRSRRQIALKQLRITEMEKSEVEYQNKIKQQQLEKVQLEKYEALLDSHFKKLEIHGKDGQLEQLRNKQQELNQQIDDYSDKLKEYEKQKAPHPTPLLLEVREMIIAGFKKQPDLQKQYVYRLNGVSNRFEESLKNQLSKINIQYCVCFLIDMPDEHIATCFSIKQESIRIIRSRIRADLGLDRNENLDRYLAGLMLFR